MRRPAPAILLAAAIGALLPAGMGVRQLRRPGARSGAAPPARHYSCETCSPATAPVSGRAARPPRIPSGSGRPCMVVFYSARSGRCKEMLAAIDLARPRLKGKVDVVRVDADRHRQEAMRWRLTLVPTAILLDAAGKEVGRHEGTLDRQGLLAEIRAAGIRADP